MSRPPGPPPYSAEEIALLTTPEARFIAQAELSSYIAGHRLADLRDQGLLSTQPTYVLTNSGMPTNSRTGNSARRSQTPSEIDSLEEHHSSSSTPSGPLRLRSNGDRRSKKNHHPYSPFDRTRPRPDDRLAPYSGSKSVESTTPIYEPEHGKLIFRVQRNNQARSSTSLCQSFTSTGTCARSRCVDIHDVEKLALCRRFLYKKACMKGAFCSLSHQRTPENTPHCLYFLESRCTNSACTFRHVNVAANGLVCENFGRLGYCHKGDDCVELHVYECPEFSNEGSCAMGEYCPLRHVHHASRMKAAFDISDPTTPQSPPDSRDANDSGEDNFSITQQHDYVAFGPRD